MYDLISKRKNPEKRAALKKHAINPVHLYIWIQAGSPNAAMIVRSVAGRFTRQVAIAFVAACIVLSSGCVSKRGAANASEEPNVARTATPASDLTAAVTEFRMTRNRWPKNQGELYAFIEQSEGKLQPITYDRIDFKENSDGSLEISSTINGVTNRMTLNANEK